MRRVAHFWFGRKEGPENRQPGTSSHFHVPFSCLSADSARFTVKHCLSAVLLRFLLLSGLLLPALGGCSLYHKVFRPYRLPTPKPSPEYLAQQKKKQADEKLHSDLAKASASVRKKSGAAPEEAATDVAGPSGMEAASQSTTAATRTLPEKSTVRYDKNGLMKKPRLERRKVHKQRKPFRPIESIRNFFKYGLHAKPNYSPNHRPAPKQPRAEPDGKP